ncbi:MAG TPA: ABC transporter permease [Bryobacteraceae bacterium]|jgi:predicted permease|nr:ABC transporter permease [Bryobacteraceae bacterium]
MPRWPFYLKKSALTTQIDSEIAFHIDRLVQEKIATGIAPDEARRQAIVEFGGREQIKEELRDVHRIPILETVAANLKSGIRLMRKSPAFSITVVLTLALGIGANSAVFSAIDAILLRPLPFPNGGDLMLLRQLNRAARNTASFVAPSRLEDWNRLNTTFQAISGWYTEDVSDLSGALPEKVTEALVAPRFLEVWGVAPALGRDFTPEEERYGGPSAVLISEAYWRHRFHSDPHVVGKRLRVEKWLYTVVGVMPASFLFPDGDVEMWTPSPADSPIAQDRRSTWFHVIGRLKHGVTTAQARADLANVQVQLGREFPLTDRSLMVEVEPLKENTVRGARRSLWVLFGSVSLLLLIACTNIAALLLARTTEREREISVRFSLGASRASVIAQLLTECFVLALTGSLLGILVAAGGAHGLRMLAKSLPRVEEIALDWRIVLYTLGCGMLATLLCGLLPALRGTRRGIAGDLAHASRTQVSTRNPLQWLLVAVQVALAVVLLVGAGLLLRSFQELGRVSPGFDPSHVVTLQISGNWGETADMKTLTRRIDTTLDDLREVPGVLGAATSATLPGIVSDSRTELKLTEGRAETEGKIFADSRFVSNGYFETMKIPLLAGESCRESANYFGTMVVNRSFADAYLSGSDAIGHHLQLGSSQFLSAPAEVTGIVGDAREQGLNRAPAPTVYWCTSAPTPFPNFLIRIQGDPMEMAETLRRKIHQIDPSRSVYGVSPLEEHLSDSFSENRLRTILLTLFALTAVLLACIGLYGTLSYFVALRRREVGLRLALGALRGQIVTQFLWKGFVISLAGCAAGLCLAIAFAHSLAGMLYGVSTADAETLFSVVLLIITVAAVSSLLPALRASRVEPMEVLREE